MKPLLLMVTGPVPPLAELPFWKTRESETLKVCVLVELLTIPNGAFSNRIESEVQLTRVLAICEDSADRIPCPFQTAPEKTGRHVRTSILPYSHGSAATCNEPQRVLSRDRDGQFRISEGVPVWQHFRAGRPGMFPKSLLTTTAGRRFNPRFALSYLPATFPLRSTPNPHPCPSR